MEAEPLRPGVERPELPSRIRQVLVVCTANHCRSPLAAAMLRTRLEERGLTDRISVESAAVRNVMVGRPPSSRMIEVARRRGIEVAGQAKFASAEILAASDLVVCMDHEQMEMLLEESRLVGGGPPVRLLLEFAPECEREEVPDPQGLDEGAFEAVADLIGRGVGGLVAVLARSVAEASSTDADR